MQTTESHLFDRENFEISGNHQRFRFPIATVSRKNTSGPSTFNLTTEIILTNNIIFNLNSLI
jgi:hypothetical protein